MIQSPSFDFEGKEVLLSATQYLFVRAQKGSEALLSEGCVSFVTENGFFAALGHNESTGTIPYVDAELYAQRTNDDKPTQAGRVLYSAPSGLYGAFYDDYTPPVFAKFRIAPLVKLKVGTPAELWMPIGAGAPNVFRGKIAALFPDKPYPILFATQDSLFPGAQFGSSGSVIIQNGKIVAVVAGANKNPAHLLYCTSAEQMAIDLWHMVYELSVTETLIE